MVRQGLPPGEGAGAGQLGCGGGQRRRAADRGGDRGRVRGCREQLGGHRVRVAIRSGSVSGVCDQRRTPHMPHSLTFPSHTARKMDVSEQGHSPGSRQTKRIPAEERSEDAWRSDRCPGWRGGSRHHGRGGRDRGQGVVRRPPRADLLLRHRQGGEGRP
ncbi:protein of unknown function [Streptomyces sp. KY75]|nr:protein of unknown function [Streptomyces sp. KY70]CAD5984906.1 protein of unknown function [Streptomyces sp. KY75]